MKTFFSSAATLLALLLVETAILSNWYILPVVPDLLLITVIYISYSNGSMMGQTTGFFSGLILDFVSASPLGLHALMRTIIGFLSGFLHQRIVLNGILFPMVVGFFGTVLKAILLTIISFFYQDGIQTYFSSGSAFINECVINAVLTPVMFKFLSNFKILQESNEIGLI
ncbi:MAG: rod shape-determining protein MreD [Treponema sp. CETP13]|nr:MAG: rod shape-determining protein MreD [Treponema sp. CETP13]